jgi:hypothetical protein
MIDKTLKEEQVRKQVRKLRSLYEGLTKYALAVLLSIFIWVMTGTEYFWPVWVIVIGAFALIMRAINLGLTPLMKDIFPFFDPAWEDKEVKRIMKQGTYAPAWTAPTTTGKIEKAAEKANPGKKKTPAKKTTTAPKKTAGAKKTSAPKKTVTKKKATKKATAKKAAAKKSPPKK